ncbi:MAG: hypothetical protein R3324_03780, partial [Halobacteriales archaeon]|nr:hypothetical protein [Halobacteriales archaeon]
MRALPRTLRLALASLAMAVLVACNTLGAPPSPQPGGTSLELDPTGTYAVGYLVIGYQADQDPAHVASSIGAQVDTDWAPLKAALLDLPDGMSVAKARSLLAGAGLRYAEPRIVIEHDPVPLTGLDAQAVDDPAFGLQWMHRQMNTQAAWDAGYTGTGIRIGIHDSYVDHRHPDLVDNMHYPGFDGYFGT